jgi:hypothetical protein
MSKIEMPPTGAPMVLGPDRIHLTRQPGNRGNSWFVGRVHEPPLAVLTLLEDGYLLSPRDIDASRTTGPSWSQLVSDFV